MSYDRHGPLSEVTLNEHDYNARVNLSTFTMRLVQALALLENVEYYKGLVSNVDFLARQEGNHMEKMTELLKEIKMINDAIEHPNMFDHAYWMNLAES